MKPTVSQVQLCIINGCGGVTSINNTDNEASINLLMCVSTKMSPHCSIFQCLIKMAGCLSVFLVYYPIAAFHSSPL